ncbi:MAG: AEC family transporter [Clostridia bacterium]|nr:AEC family transporter [Clostridia bacterium]
MTVFSIAFIAVLVLLCAAVPGFLLVKCGKVSEGFASDLSKLLLYIGMPCLSIYTFATTEYSIEKLRDLGIFACLTFVMLGVMLGGAYLLLRKKLEKPLCRIMVIATSFANCSFFGIPIVEALLPDIAADIVIYTTVFAVVMNIVGWTLGVAIISGDARFVSLKKAILNPAALGLFVALPIFIFQIPIQADFLNMITISARMTSPLSMIIMGMRLATMDIKATVLNYRIYLTVFAKQILMPALAFALIVFLPVSLEIKQTFFIMCSCPIASVVLNYSEMIGEAQKEAAGALLLGTMASILTLPLMMLLLPLL